MSIPDLPSGHVRVLVERPRDQQLANAAAALLAGGNPSDVMRDYISSGRSPSGLIIDPTFGAVPVGPGRAMADISPRAFDPAASEKFLVRGFVEVQSSAHIPEEIDQQPVYSDPAIASFRTCGNSRAVGDTSSVRQKLNTAALAAQDLDGSGVAIAIVDTGIYLPRLTERLGAPPAFDKANSWKFNTVTEPGEHRLGHGTMCAYDALIAAPMATLLDIAMLIARAPGDHRGTGTVGGAMQAYAHLLNMWVNGPRPEYKALVVSNSWGIYHPSLEDFDANHPWRFIDNPNHIFRLQIRALEQAGVDIVFAGNNCGPDCPAAPCLSRTGGMIMGASAYTEVLTVAGCDINDDRVGYSSRGPSIAKMPQEKPDISAYTHFLGSKTRRNYLPDTGVSTACPVAAGCVAALRSSPHLSPASTPPAVLFDALRNTARQGNGGGPDGAWNPDYGYGIINPVAAAQSLGVPMPEGTAIDVSHSGPYRQGA